MKNEKLYFQTASLVLLLFIFTGCFSETDEDSPQVTIEDEAGRQISIQAQVETIISLSPSNTEILFALGFGEKIAGVTEFCNYPAPALKKPRVGGFLDINIEKIIELDPDIVLASNLHLSDVVPALEKLDIVVVVIDPQDVPSVFDSIKFIGKITGTEQQAEELTVKLKTEYNKLTNLIKGKERPRVFWELSEDLWTPGPGSFINDLIKRARGENIAAGATSSWVQLSNETIIESDPEVIFLADHPFGVPVDKVSGRPGWDSINAVINKRIIEITDVDTISRPGPRVIDALEYIAKVLHPECF